MRPVLLTVAAVGLVLVGAGAASITEHKAEADSGGISTIALSRCAGMAGIEMREADPAFGQLMLDGAPWLTAQHDDDAVVVNGTGTLRRRNGTTAPFRFFCVLDEAGHAKMFRIIPTAAGESSPSSRLIMGVAVPAGLKMPLPRGSELRIQLLDIKKDPKGELVAEQVVRSGWEVPIPFALRPPADMNVADRQLVISARIVLSRATIFRMAHARAVTLGDLQRPVTLDLSP
jgi:uncharacterized lipoprotein YbaY